MSGPSKSRVVLSYDKLTVRIRFCFPDFNHAILIVRAQCIIELHRPVSPAKLALCRPRPRIGMGKYSPIFFQPRIHPRDKTDLIIRFCIGRGVQQKPIRRVQILVYTVHRHYPFVLWRSPWQHCPCIWLQVHFPFCIFLCADFASVFGNAADIPLSIPEFPVAGYFYTRGTLPVLSHIVPASKARRQLHKVL